MAQATGYFIQDGVSDDFQQQAIADYANQNGLTISSVFSDLPASKQSLNRRELVNALIEANKQAPKHLIISKYDDLLSNRLDGEYFIENALESKRITLHSVAERVNSATEHGMASLKSHIAKLDDRSVQKSISLSKAISRVNYQTILKNCHILLKPKFYVEIGVKFGKSMMLSNCDALGIDPEPRVNSVAQNPRARICKSTSDAFFADPAHPEKIKPGSIDLAFIDGMHLFDFALRDFINIEKNGHRGTVVAIDDVFPRNALEAMPDWLVMAWAGDVWKLMLCLRRYRPDLEVVITDAYPTGIALIGNINPNDTSLQDNYDEIIEYFRDIDYVSVGDHRDYLLSRTAADAPYITTFLQKYGASRLD